MAPEQVRSAQEADARTDIWALGAILFELCTGRPPFAGKAPFEVCAAVVADPAPPLREILPDAPPGLAATVARCLEKSRDHRFQTLHELAGALAEFGTSMAHASRDRIARILAPARSTAASEPALPRDAGCDESSLETNTQRIDGGKEAESA
jgi:serine/threonine-protein kinase